MIYKIKDIQIFPITDICNNSKEKNQKQRKIMNNNLSNNS